MSLSQNICRSFFGGLELNKIAIHWPYIFVYAILYAFYELYFYYPKIQTKNSRLIGCGALLSIILIFKFIFLFIRLLTRFEIKQQNQQSQQPAQQSQPAEEERPSHIPPEIWRHKKLLINSHSEIDAVVNDLIVSGVDSGGILELVDYLQDTNQFNQVPETIETISPEASDISNHRMIIQICGATFTLPFSLHQIDQISPSTPSLICVLFSVIFGFSSSYLSMTLLSQFSVYEKSFLAFVLASSTFSIILPPPVDPYNTSINDPWNACARPLVITIICTAWRLIIKYVCESSSYWETCTANTIILPQIYDIKIEWNIILPYIFVALRYGLFLTLAMFIGVYSHPVSSIVALLESGARYFLGQNGVSGILHIIVQLLRGAASVASVWGIFQIKDPNSTEKLLHEDLSIDSIHVIIRCSKFRLQMLCCAIAASTLINTFPFMLNRFLIKHWVSTFLYPLLACVLSFIFPFIFVSVVDSSFDGLKWFCFSYLTLFELVFPYLYSGHQYFFCHFIVLPRIPFSPIFRYISSLIVSPLFVAASLQFQDRGSPLDDLIVAFVVTHAVHKMHAEPHVFAFAVFLCALSLPIDFGLKNPAVNLAISLLVASKAESALPVVKLVQNNRNYQIVMDELFEVNELPSIARYIIMKLLNNVLILFDTVFKIPAMFWCLVAGGGIGPMFGCPYFFMPQPIRPNYFFDWPRNMDVYKSAYRKESSEKEEGDGNLPLSRTPTSVLTSLFEKNINEHPVETPVYMSAVRAVAKCVGPIMRSGRFGYVSANSVFLFKSKSNNAAFFLHVISVEPSCFRFQLRGLEYKSQTICHEGEEMNLDEIVNDYDFTGPNVHAAFFATATDYDMRVYSMEMMMYDVSTTRLSQAFIGIEGESCLSWFLYCFAFGVRKFAFSDEPINMRNYVSSLALSVNEDTGEAGARISALAEMLLSKFQNLPDEANEFEFIERARPLFKRALSFFANADENGEVNGGYDMSVLLPFNDIRSGTSSISVADLFFNCFMSTMSCVFDEQGHLNVKNAAANFDGTHLTGWADERVHDLPHDARNLVLQSVRDGYIACFLASASLLDLPEGESDNEEGLPSDAGLFDVIGQLGDIEREAAVAPINSQLFASEFIVGERKLYSIAGEKILMFNLSNTQWSVFQVNHEYVRGLWSMEARDILFFGNEDSERMSIQENIYFLNNLIIQACESPIGYPAYCSEIFEAYANPLMKDNLVLQ